MKSKILSLLFSVILLGGQTKISAPTQIKQLANSNVYWYAAPLSFGTIGATSCKEANIVVPSATPGYLIIQGWPSFLPPSIHGIMYSASSIVVVRLCNVSTLSVDVPILTYSVGVIKQ